MSNTDHTFSRYREGDPVSVVLICHNKASNLVPIVRELAVNTRRPNHIVLSDDGSTDGSQTAFLEACDRFGVTGKVIEHDAAGEAPAFRINTLRNDGIRACPTGLVAVLDADLLPGRTHLETHAQLHLAHPENDVISTGPRLESANPDGSGPVNFMWGHEPVAMIQPSTMKPIPSWTAVPGSLMAITTGLFDRLGGFDTDYDGHYGVDDMDFMYRADQAGVFFAGAFGAYVIHLPHPPVFGQRSNERNRELFRTKHGFDVYSQMPSLYKKLGRQAWSDYYDRLRTGDETSDNTSRLMHDYEPVVLRALDFSQIDGRVLLSIALRRAWTKILRPFGVS